jgi:hypothetical protein
MPTPCTDCNKMYTTYKGWWNHRKRYHEQAHTQNGKQLVNIPTTPRIENVITKSEVDILQCKKCNRLFSHRQSRWRHEQTCKADEICTIEPTTNHIDTANNMNSINNGSYNEINNTINNGTLNNTTNNTNITNNITVVLGSENLDEVLTKNEILSVLKKQYGCIEELVSLVHASSKYNQFKNVYISSLKDKFAYKYDKAKSKFIATNKADLLDEILEQRMFNIRDFCEELKDDMPPRRYTAVMDLLDKLDNEDSMLKSKKKENIMLVLYNNREIIKPHTNL